MSSKQQAVARLKHADANANERWETLPQARAEHTSGSVSLACVNHIKCTQTFINVPKDKLCIYLMRRPAFCQPQT